MLSFEDKGRAEFCKCKWEELLCVGKIFASTLMFAREFNLE